MRSIKNAYSTSIATLAVVLPVFFWSILTEKTSVRLEAADGRLVLRLNDKHVGHAAIPPYRTAILGLMLRQDRQAGEGFCQGWGPIELRAQKTGNRLFSDRSIKRPPTQWRPFTGAWVRDFWGHYTLRPKGGDYMAYGEMRLEDMPLDNFIFEGTVFNLSSAGISLATNDGNDIAAHIDIYPGPVIGWFYNAKDIGTTYGVDLSIPDDEKLNLWPGKSKTVKNVIAKIAGTLIAAELLILSMLLLVSAPALYFRLAGRFWKFMSGGATHG